jgi:TolB-like protein
MNALKQLIHEIHSRSLWQVLGIYLLGSWVALQVVDVLADNFGLPDWFPPFALALLVIGLPIVLATAFVQDGVRPQPSAPSAPVGGVAAAAPAARRALLTWRHAILGGVGAFALWGVVAGGWLLLGPGLGRGTQPADRPSIAVLPFSNRSADAGEDAAFFAAGMHEDLLTQLSKIQALTVISRTSVMQYEGTRKTIREIGAELGVAAVLEGGVERAGDRVRVNVQLIDARTDRHIWAETYDEELTAANIFAIRTDLARQIAAALRATLAPSEEQRLEARPTESLEAYDLYTRGRYVLSGRGSTREGVEAAADLFRQAIAADSAFAPAHAGLARAYHQLWNLGYLHEQEAFPQARAALERALALDPDLAEAHALLGSLLRAERRLDEAERQHRRAIELDPGSAQAHQAYSALLLDLGRVEESLREARRGVELDPLSAGARRGLLARLVFARRNDEAIAESQKLIELEPNEADAYYYAGIAYTGKGEHERGIAAYRRAMAMNPADPYYPAGLAWAYAMADQRDSALAYLGVAEQAGVPLKEIALVYGALGDLDRAYDYLERAYETEPATLSGLSADPSSDPLRADPRWGLLMRKLRLE